MTLSGAPGAHLAERARGLIRPVPDFPIPGVLFQDVMPLLADGPMLAAVIDHMVRAHRRSDFDVVAGIEARGFLLAAPIAYAAGCGVVAIRKAGKLPGQTFSTPYDLEYGGADLEIQQTAFAPGQRVLVVDDVLATGGTLTAALGLVHAAAAAVAGVAVLVELSALAGRDRLPVAVTPLVVV